MKEKGRGRVVNVGCGTLAEHHMTVHMIPRFLHKGPSASAHDRPAYSLSNTELFRTFAKIQYL